MLRDPAATALLVLVVVAQMATAPVAGPWSAHVLPAGQERADPLLVDELSDSVASRDQPRGAP